MVKAQRGHAHTHKHTQWSDCQPVNIQPVDQLKRERSSFEVEQLWKFQSVLGQKTLFCLQLVWRTKLLLPADPSRRNICVGISFHNREHVLLLTAFMSTSHLTHKRSLLTSDWTDCGRSLLALMDQKNCQPQEWRPLSTHHSPLSLSILLPRCEARSSHKSRFDTYIWSYGRGQCLLMLAQVTVADWWSNVHVTVATERSP